MTLRLFILSILSNIFRIFINSIPTLIAFFLKNIGYSRGNTTTTKQFPFWSWAPSWCDILWLQCIFSKLKWPNGLVLWILRLHNCVNVSLIPSGIIILMWFLFVSLWWLGHLNGFLTWSKHYLWPQSLHNNYCKYLSDFPQYRLFKNALTRVVAEDCLCNIHFWLS